MRRTSVHPDEMRDEMEWGREPAERLLEANPELQLHHMHDPNQDRLTIRYMSYFRVKRLRLGRAFERFIVNSVEPGGTIFLLECNKPWPVKRVGHRHFFQPGAVGGMEPEDYIEGTPRVAEFLEREESHPRAWEPPEPDAMAPEAEWGFEPALRADVERFAEQNGYRVRRIVFDEPEDMSPLVADLYRWTYRRRRMPGDRLVGESFIVFEPWWTLRTGSVPFWMKFNVDSSAEALERYLDSTDPFDEILLMVFSHGVDSVGLAATTPSSRTSRRATRFRDRSPSACWTSSCRATRIGTRCGGWRGAVGEARREARKVLPTRPRPSRRASVRGVTGAPRSAPRARNGARAAIRCRRSWERTTATGTPRAERPGVRDEPPGGPVSAPGVPHSATFLDGYHFFSASRRSSARTCRA